MEFSVRMNKWLLNSLIEWIVSQVLYTNTSKEKILLFIQCWYTWPQTLFPSWQIGAFICIWVPLVEKGRSPRTAAELGRDVLHFRTSRSLPICEQQRFCTFASAFITRSHRAFVHIKLLWWQKPNISPPCSGWGVSPPSVQDMAGYLFHLS